MQLSTSHLERSSQAMCRTRRVGAFTLLELVVVSVIILMMVGFLASALGRTTRSARQTASQRSAEAIAAAVEQFRLEFGFLPPLVHDGPMISAGDPNFQPFDQVKGMNIDGPVINRSGDIPGVAYNFDSIVVWELGSNFDFFRRRDGGASDEIELPSGSSPWDINTAWDDRRYSRFALAYYLNGALPRSTDGVAGEGMARPMANGWFQGVGYPVGGTRDRYEPTIDTNRRGVTLRTGYARPVEVLEHGASGVPIEDMEPDDVYSLYAPGDRDNLVALVDSFGTAFRYYRWEHGRYNNLRRLVTETVLDLNIPPVLLDPEALVELQNDDSATTIPDLTQGHLDIRQARFAIVGAGADGLFGTEPIDYLAEAFNMALPGNDEEIARIRKKAMNDNVVAFGK